MSYFTQPVNDVSEVPVPCISFVCESSVENAVHNFVVMFGIEPTIVYKKAGNKRNCIYIPAPPNFNPKEFHNFT